MPNAFGFPNYENSQPSVPAHQIGAALVQQRMQPQPAAANPASLPTRADTEEGDEAQRLRELGAIGMGAKGQISAPDQPPGSPHSPGSVAHSVGEALTRLGGGYKTNPNLKSSLEGRRRSLMQHGLSEVEADLMIETGGV